jgi:hypothetical protein
MDPVIPSPDIIPVHWLWFQVLLVVTFILHLILMNLILGGSLLALWDKIRGRKEPDYAITLPVLVALTINLGVPPLLFVQVLFGHLFYTASVTQAVPWILVIPALILGYYGSYIYVKKRNKSPRLATTGLMVSLLLILYTGFMLVNNSTLTLVPDRFTAHLNNPGGFNLNIGEPSLWPRYLHFITSAIAIAALGVAVYTKYTLKENPEKASLVIRTNLRRFAWFTLAQFAFGTLFWLTTPRDVWMIFMGKNITATILMTLSWLLAASMIYTAFRGRLWITVLHASIVLVIMVIMREYMRSAYLKDYFSPSQLESKGEFWPLIVFLILFAAGLGAIYYMIRLATKKNNQS